MVCMLGTAVLPVPGKIQSTFVFCASRKTPGGCGFAVVREGQDNMQHEEDFEVCRYKAHRVGLQYGGIILQHGHAS